MGKEAEVAFTHSWGVSYGMGQVGECQDIAHQVAQGIVVLIILDQLRLVPIGKWLERHMDILSVQASLLAESQLQGRHANIMQRWATYKIYFGRVSGD